MSTTTQRSAPGSTSRVEDLFGTKPLLLIIDRIIRPVSFMGCEDRNVAN